jgi:hypothetical protein
LALALTSASLLPPRRAGDPRWNAGDGWYRNVFGIEKYDCK